MAPSPNIVFHEISLTPFHFMLLLIVVAAQLQQENVCSRPEHLSAVMPCDEPRQGCNIARSRDNVANINIRTDIYNILLKDSVFPHMRNPPRIPGFGSNEGRRDSCVEIYSGWCDSVDRTCA